MKKVIELHPKLDTNNKECLQRDIQEALDYIFDTLIEDVSNYKSYESGKELLTEDKQPLLVIELRNNKK
jgi:hypothetical protein